MLFSSWQQYQWTNMLLQKKKSISCLFIGCTPTFFYLFSTAVISSAAHLDYRKTSGDHWSFNHLHIPTINRYNISFVIHRKTLLRTSRRALSSHSCSNMCHDVHLGPTCCSMAKPLQHQHLLASCAISHRTEGSTACWWGVVMVGDEIISG